MFDYVSNQFTIEPYTLGSGLKSIIPSKVYASLLCYKLMNVYIINTVYIFLVRDWSLKGRGGGLQNWRGGACEVLPLLKGGRRIFF